MNGRIAYLWLKNGDFESLLSVLSGFEDFSARRREDGIMIVSDPGQDDPAEYEHVREMAMQEFFQDFAAFIAPDSPGFDMEPFLPLLKKVNPGIYRIADLISEVVFANRPELKSILKKYYYSLFGTETIETVLGFIKADQNASQAAAGLFLHRNTLNYRLDHFIALSGIDVRTFKGAFALHLLFR